MFLASTSNSKGEVMIINNGGQFKVSRGRGLIAYLCCFVFFAGCSFGVMTHAETGLSEYTLGAGDVIRIQVFGHENMTTEGNLSDAGTISFPFLGEMRVLGLTVGQLESDITEKLKDGYLLDPKVTVSLVTYRNVYIEGEVVKPGGYSFRPGLTVRKAISLAQGFTELASRRKIYAISEGDESRKARKVELEDFVKPGDVITVKESFF